MNVATVANGVAAVAALVIGAALSFGVFRLLGEQHKASCIADAEARFPAVVLHQPVQGLSPAQGPRVTSLDQRRAALDACRATAF